MNERAEFIDYVCGRLARDPLFPKDVNVTAYYVQETLYALFDEMRAHGIQKVEKIIESPHRVEPGITNFYDPITEKSKKPKFPLI